MLLIRCTGKLRKEMGLKDKDLYQQDHREGLGPWHANLIFIQRSKCLLFTNDKTLFNFIIPDLRRADIRNLHPLFLSFLGAVLAEEGISPRQREKIMAEYDEIAFGKSTNKSVLSSMNELAYHYKYLIMSEGGVNTPYIPNIIKGLNRMPMGALEYQFSVDVLKQFLNEMY